MIEDWRTIYNLKRPHSSRGWKPPAAYAASLNRQPGRKQPDSHNGWTDKRGPASSIGSARYSSTSSQRVGVVLGLPHNRLGV